MKFYQSLKIYIYFFNFTAVIKKQTLKNKHRNLRKYFPYNILPNSLSIFPKKINYENVFVQ